MKHFCLFFWILTCSSLLLPAPAQAGKWLSKAFGRAGKRATVPMVKAKPIPQTLNISLTRCAADAFHSSTWQPLVVDTKHLFQPIASEQMIKQDFPTKPKLAKTYQTTLAETTALLNELDTFLWYHSKDERRQLPSAEVADWLVRIAQCERQVALLQRQQLQDSLVLERAKERLTWARNFFSLKSKGSRHEWRRENRDFDEQEFIMSKPTTLEPVQWHKNGFWHAAQPSRAYQAPKKISVAVINDDEEVLRWLYTLQDEEFFPEWEFTLYHTADRFLQDVSQGNEHFDIVFTDLILAEGSSGHEVIASLRKRNFEGLVFVASFYEFSSENIYHFFEKGFDGVFPLNRYDFRQNVSVPRALAQSLENFFYYAKQHGWKLPASLAVPSQEIP